MAAFLALRALWPAVAQDAPLKSETMFGTHSKFKFVWFRESFYQWLVFGSLDVHAAHYRMMKSRARQLHQQMRMNMVGP